MPVARIEDQSQVEYSHHSILQHRIISLDDDGDVVAAFSYGPFGEILAETGAAADHLRRFNDKEHDQFSNLYYYGYRYYDPYSLHWTQGDPLYRFLPDLAYDDPRRMNLYTFNLNNPLRYLDPDGLHPAGCFGQPCQSVRNGVGATIYSSGAKAFVSSVGRGARRAAPVALEAAEFAPVIGNAVGAGRSLVNAANALAQGDLKGAGLNALEAGASALGGKPAKVGAKQVTRGTRRGPSPNDGKGGRHGGDNHNSTIDNRADELRQDPNVENIRKNQQQVDAHGNNVGNNRPDLQWDNVQEGRHYNVEYDNRAK